MAVTGDSLDKQIEMYRELLEQLERDHLEMKLGIASSTEGASDHFDEIRKSIVSVTSELTARFRQEQGFIEVSREIAKGVYLDEVLDHIYELFRPLIPFDRLGCAFLERGGAVARARWSRTDYQRVRLKVGFWAKMADSSLQPIVDTGEPRIINDLAEYLAQHPKSMATRLMVAEGVRSSLTCPLIAEGQPIGFLFFSSTKADCYATEHQDAFLRLADLVSIAVQKSQVLEEMSRLNQELTQARLLLEYQKSHDMLTGGMSRSAVIEDLVSRTDRESDWPYTDSRGLCVLVLDIDRFRSVNETYGHIVGDQVLRSVSDSLASQMRSSDRVGRYGGGQFLVVAEISKEYEPRALAERLRIAVEQRPIVTDSGRIPITVSVGLALLEPGVRELSHSLIRRADGAVREAKTIGRNQVVVAAFDAT